MVRRVCRHQDGERYCQKLRVGCRPGMVGCVLRGKEHFSYDEEGFPILGASRTPHPKKSRLAPKVLKGFS